MTKLEENIYNCIDKITKVDGNQSIRGFNNIYNFDNEQLIESIKFLCNYIVEIENELSRIKRIQSNKIYELTSKVENINDNISTNFTEYVKTKFDEDINVKLKTMINEKLVVEVPNEIQKEISSVTKTITNNILPSLNTKIESIVDTKVNDSFNGHNNFVEKQINDNIKILSTEMNKKIEETIAEETKINFEQIKLDEKVIDIFNKNLSDENSNLSKKIKNDIENGVEKINTNYLILNQDRNDVILGIKDDLKNEIDNTLTNHQATTINQVSNIVSENNTSSSLINSEIEKLKKQISELSITSSNEDSNINNKIKTIENVLKNIVGNDFVVTDYKTVIYNLSNVEIIGNKPYVVQKNKLLTIQFKAEDGYKLPESKSDILVKEGDKIKSISYYDYNTGELRIDDIKDDIIITIKGVFINNDSDSDSDSDRDYISIFQELVNN